MEALSPREHQRERDEICRQRAMSTADIKPIWRSARGRPDEIEYELGQPARAG
jgi:hypothetical protein